VSGAGRARNAVASLSLSLSLSLSFINLFPLSTSFVLSPDNVPPPPSSAARDRLESARSSSLRIDTLGAAASITLFPRKAGSARAELSPARHGRRRHVSSRGLYRAIGPPNGCLTHAVRPRTRSGARFIALTSLSVFPECSSSRTTAHTRVADPESAGSPARDREKERERDGEERGEYSVQKGTIWRMTGGATPEGEVEGTLHSREVLRRSRKVRAIQAPASSSAIVISPFRRGNRVPEEASRRSSPPPPAPSSERRRDPVTIRRLNRSFTNGFA